MNLINILKKYTEGNLSVEEANAELKKGGSGLTLIPDKNVITEEEQRATTVGVFADQANGWGLLDQGIPPLQKVKVENGKLIDCDMGEAFALCIIGGKVYEVKKGTLV